MGAGNGRRVEQGREIKVTEEEAKAIIREDPKGDVIQRLTAIAVAEQVLGDTCTMEEIWKWADKKDSE